MTGCSVPGCGSRSEDGHKFCETPRNPERRKIWLKFCNKSESDYAGRDRGPRLCYRHFDPNDFDVYRNGSRRLQRGANPILKEEGALSNSQVMHQDPNRIQFLEVKCDHTYAKMPDDDESQQEKTILFTLGTQEKLGAADWKI